MSGLVTVRPGAIVRGLLLAVALATASAAAHAGVAGGQFRYWAFTDHDDLRDVIAYWAPGPVHLQLEVWDRERGRDEFRPEVGVHLRDRRRSSYSAQWRHEFALERVTLGTEQKLSQHFVGKLYVSPLLGRDAVPVVWQAGLDGYWHSYSFAGADLIRDPRGDDLWVVLMRMRWANESNDWVQATVAPASRRTIGWALDAKWHGVRIGFERNSRFDFSTRDNIIATLGYEWTLPNASE